MSNSKGVAKGGAKVGTKGNSHGAPLDPFGRFSLFLRSIAIDFEKIDHGSYLHGIESIRSLDTLTFSRPVTLFAGENGSGKSTLLEAIAARSGFNPEGGSQNYRFSTFDSHSELSSAMKLMRGIRRPKWGYFLRAESFYNVATKETEYAKFAPISYVPEALHEKSHGESFLATAQRHLKPEGLYFLDEPEAALSPQMQLALLALIFESAKTGSQFFIATHSPILLGMPDAEILLFDEGKIRPCDYEETGSYRITKLFLDNRERMLRELLSEE